MFIITERGFSFIETILALVILFFITMTLIPVSFQMKQHMALQKVQAHAAEVAFNGALKYSRYGEQYGSQEIDSIQYDWHVLGTGICVAYEYEEVREELCV